MYSIFVLVVMAKIYLPNESLQNCKDKKQKMAVNERKEDNVHRKKWLIRIKQCILKNWGTEPLFSIGSPTSFSYQLLLLLIMK